MAAINFDATNAPQQDVYESMPAGWYNAAITASEMKPTKSGDGSFLALLFEVVDGPYKGRKVFTNLNLRNPNQMAVEIAYKQLSSICHATGVLQVSDSTQLHNRPLQMKLKVKPAQGDYEASNEISGFAKLGEHPTVNQKAGQAAPAPAFAAPVAPPAFPAQQQAQAWQAPAAPVAPAAPAWQAPAAPQGWQQPAPVEQAPAPQAWQQPAPQAPAPTPPSWQQPAQQQPPQAPQQQPAFQPPVQAAPSAPAAPAPVAAPAPADGMIPPPWQQLQQ